MVFPWYSLAIISALFSAIAALLEKKLLFKEKIWGFVGVLALFNFVLSIPFLINVDINSITLIGFIGVLIKSILEAGAFFCVMFGIQKLEISEALPLLVLTPGLVAIFSFLILGEALKGIEIMGLLLLLAGTYLLQINTKKGVFYPVRIFSKSKGHWAILIALALYTTTSVLDKAILSRFNVSPNAFLGLQHFFLAIIFIFLVFLLGKTGDFKITFKRAFIWLLVLSVVTITYRYTQMVAVKQAPVALVMALKRISVFFAVLIGGKLFKEHNRLIRIIATAIMVAGALVIIYA